ncbi:MAG: acetyltransferase [Oscillospiraceae bacterium]|nr:acetyltransferase [Oscillospiraceae bacterium]
MYTDARHNINLKPLDDDDISLAEKWLNKKHVKKWFDIPECSLDDWLYEMRERKSEFKFLNHFIVLAEATPIGFCQYYRCSDALEDWYGDVPLQGTYSIDYFIGEEDYLGKGYGKAMINTLISKIFSLPDAERILVETDKNNIESINTLLSIGFNYDSINDLYFMKK